MFAKLLRNRAWCFYGKQPENAKRHGEAHAFRNCQTLAAAAPVWSLYNCKRTVKASKYGFTEGPACIETTCPCGSKATAPKIFINKTSGNFSCPQCHYNGKFSGIEEFFAEPKSKDQTVDISQKRTRFRERKPEVSLQLPSLKPIQDLTDQEMGSLIENFSLEIPPQAMKDLEIFTLEQDLYIPLKNVYDEIIGYKIMNQEHGERSLPEKNSFGCAIKRNQKKESNTAIIVLTVLDYIALASQKNLSQTIICLPHGFHSLPQECLPMLEKYQKLILWFDYNCSSAGWDVARNFAKKLDERRCYLIRPTESQTSAYESFREDHDLKAIISKSLPLLHKSITTFGSLREDVLSDLQNIDKVQGVKWRRYPTLSKLLKGHRKGELTILTGSTGCGKTTFMSEYSLDLALQGVTTLWGSFEIRNTRLAATLLRQLAGHPFDPVANLADFNYWADEFERLPVYFMTFHGQQSIKVVMEAIEHATYVNDIQHVIIDNVQFMMGLSEEVRHGDRFWKQDAIIAAFRAFATKKNCHVTLVIHPRKERDSEDLSTSSIFGSAKASQEADNVLIIQDKRLQSVRGKKFLQVAKNRYSGDLGIMPLDFDKQSLSYAQRARGPSRGKEPNVPAEEAATAGY